MIIFFNKNSGKIYGVNSGRVHTQEELDTNVIPNGVNQTEIKKVILDIESTKKIEKYLEKANKHLLHHKIDIQSEELSLIPEEIIAPQKPNATDTIIIDLTKPLDEIFNSFSETTRRYIRQSEKLEFREYGFNEGRDLAMEVIKELEDRKDVHIGSQILRIRAPFLDGLRRLYIVTENKKPVATSIITPYFKRFTYTVGGVNLRGREAHAGDRLIWGLIQDAKHLGFTEFDFGGLFTEEQPEEIKKVNQFKLRWGGKKASLDKSKTT